MKGLKVLVTAGPTKEMIDPVRYITNHSTGKIGYAIARVCARRGAEVTLVSGQTALKAPEFVHTVWITSAKEMFNEVIARAEDQDIIIKAAAVADYRPKQISSEKIKKENAQTGQEEEKILALERTGDILAYLGEYKRAGQFLCGFAMETQNLLENARRKLEKKHLDMIVANSLREEGAGFGGDTNVATLVTEDEEVSLGKMSKEETAAHILDKILAQMKSRGRED